MRFDQRRQTLMYFGKRFFPTRFDKFAIAFDERAAQAIRVFMQVFERYAFGADVAVTKYILLCTPYADNFFALSAYFQATTSLVSQRQDSIYNLHDYDYQNQDLIWFNDLRLERQGTVSLQRGFGNAAHATPGFL